MSLITCTLRTNQPHSRLATFGPRICIRATPEHPLAISPLILNWRYFAPSINQPVTSLGGELRDELPPDRRLQVIRRWKDPI